MRNILPFLALLITISVPALADFDRDHDQDHGHDRGHDDANGEMRDEPHHGHFSVGIGPAWVHVLRSNYGPAFTNNGFSAPGNDRVGSDLTAYWTCDQRWQLGAEMTAFSLQQDVGSNEATYSNSMFGLFAAKDFSNSPDWDLTAGATLGWNSASLEVISATQGSLYRESAAVISPNVSYDVRISRLFKVGLRGSYFIPFGESSQLVGQNLGVSKISARGFLLATQLILSRF